MLGDISYVYGQMSICTCMLRQSGVGEGGWTQMLINGVSNGKLLMNDQCDFCYDIFQVVIRSLMTI